MAQKIKIQDGNIVYAASDPAQSINFGINGFLNVTDGLDVGNVSWPDGSIPPNQGMYVGAISLNTLQFLSFNIGSVPSNKETDAALNILFPTASAGQFATGPSTVYQSLGSGNWRKLSGNIVSSTPPVSAIGSVGDKAGDAAFDTSYYYVCVANYNGVSNIWYKTALIPF